MSLSSMSVARKVYLFAALILLVVLALGVTYYFSLRSSLEQKAFSEIDSVSGRGVIPQAAEKS